jgi:hypothetical protein
MFMYQGIIVRQDDGQFVAAILQLNHGDPNCDTIKEYTASNEEEAMIWVDDEVSKLVEGKGVWE